MTSRLFEIDPVALKEYEALFGVVQEGFNQALFADSDQFFYNIDQYFNKVPELKQQMVARGKQYLLGMNSTGNPYSHFWSSVDHQTERVFDDYFAILDVLNNFVVVGVDMETAGNPTALFTRNMSLLTELYHNSCLEEDLSKSMEFLFGARSMHALNKGVFATVRLDISRVVNHNIVFTPSTPKSHLNIGWGRRWVIIPVPFYYLFEDTLRKVFFNNPFTISREIGSKPLTQVTAIDPYVIRELYKSSDPSLVERKINKVQVGYDPMHQRFLSYDLEASVSSFGVVSFRPEMLDFLEPANIANIDLSMHNVNFTLLKAIFKTRVSRLKHDKLETLGFIDISSYANMHDKVEAILTTASRVSDKMLYNFMKSRPDVFGDLDQALKKRERITPRFLKNFDPVALPNDQRMRVEQMYDMLKHGVVHFIATEKDGTLFEGVVTNNPRALKWVFGDDYVKKFESPRNRLYYVRNLLRKEEEPSVEFLEKLAVEYNILDYVDQGLFFHSIKTTGNVTSAISTLNDGITSLKLRQGDKYYDPGTVFYRNIEATSDRSFFGNVNVNSLISVDFTEAK